MQFFQMSYTGTVLQFAQGRMLFQFRIQTFRWWSEFNTIREKKLERVEARPSV
jgi:hypothetical protein